jgi:hypothetical protein
MLAGTLTTTLTTTLKTNADRQAHSKQHSKQHSIQMLAGTLTTGARSCGSRQGIPQRKGSPSGSASR